MERKMKSSRFVVAIVAFAGFSAMAGNLLLEASKAGCLELTVVQGKVTEGLLANAVDGNAGWGSKYCMLSAAGDGNVVPSEENPIIVEAVIGDSFREGQNIVVSRVAVSGVNNQYSSYYPCAPLRYKVLASHDGSNWEKLSDDSGLPAPAANAASNFVIPAFRRGNYRRYRFVVTQNNGYEGSDYGTLFIQNIALLDDPVYCAAPDGSAGADGTSWAAATTLENAVSSANGAAYSEIHLKAGRYEMSGVMSFTTRVTLIGGYAGTDELSLSADGARSVLDGQGSVEYGYQDTGTATSWHFGESDNIENIEFTNFTSAGLQIAKQGAQGLQCRNCRFSANRDANGSRGVELSGSTLNDWATPATRFRFYDCEFESNGFTADFSPTAKFTGAGISAKRGILHLENCRFSSNGVHPDTDTANKTDRFGLFGSAIYCGEFAALEMVGCEFRQNRAAVGKYVWDTFAALQGGGTVVMAGTVNIDSVVDHCAFVANETVALAASAANRTIGGLAFNFGNAGNRVKVSHCTFAHNADDIYTGSAGLTVVKGTVALSNSIFYGNSTGEHGTEGADLAVQASGTIDISHALFTEAAKVTSAGAMTSDNVIYGDPLFVSAQDIHLKTPAGYRRDGDAAWCTDAAAASPAIDAGNPASIYASEPEPNGGRVNLGFYGNTVEASKSGGGSGSGSGGDSPGGEGDDSQGSVIYVRPDASGTGNGTSWNDAYADLQTALLAITSDKNEIWFAGTHLCSADCKVTIPSGVPATIRGGFVGTETSADDRVPGAVSVVDGNERSWNTLDITSDSELRIERIAFRNSKERGVKKSGAGSLTLADCEISGCGYALGNADGRGLLVEGGSAGTLFTAERCVIAGNGIAPADLGYTSRHDAGRGMGAAFKNLARATLEDCVFVTNGIPFAQPVSDVNGFRLFKGSAIFAENAPVMARGCRFLCNRAWCSNGSEPASADDLMGATVRLGAGTGGSAFTNCLWLANQNTIGFNGHRNYGGGGELWFNPGESAAACDVVNCTFAANLDDIWANGAGGLNVRSGRVRVLNSIFGGNLVTCGDSAYTQTGVSVGEDVYVADGAEVLVGYSLFSAAGEDKFSAGAGSLVRGEGVLFGDPEFVSRMEEVKYMQVTTSWREEFLGAALDRLLGLNVHLSGGAGYVDETRNVRVRVLGASSPAIDAGDPACDYSCEPNAGWGSNGGRINLGFYGNTPYATATYPRRGLIILIDAQHNAESVEYIDKVGPQPPQDDIVVCDQSDGSIGIYRDNAEIWRWRRQDDGRLPSDIKINLSTAVSECRIVRNGTAVAVADTVGFWMVVDIATTNTVAYGIAKNHNGSGLSSGGDGMPHSIDLIHDDIVAVACTDTQGDQDNKGVYFFHIANDKAMNPGSQNETFLAMDNPHGFYYDPGTRLLYVSSSTGIHELEVGYNNETSSIEVSQRNVWEIAPLGVKWGHDLARVPGTDLLAMTTYECIVFLDLKTGEWKPDMTVWRLDAKGFDPYSNGSHFLATVPKSPSDLKNCPASKTWVTDTIEVYTREGGFKPYFVKEGALFYKARWANTILKQ